MRLPEPAGHETEGAEQDAAPRGPRVRIQGHADAARGVAERLEREGALGLRGLAVGWRDEGGEVRSDHAVPVASAGAAGGGRRAARQRDRPLRARPLLGAKLSELGLDQLVVKDVVRALAPERAALFVLADAADAQRPHRPTVVQTTLPQWQERDLVRALADDDVTRG